MSLTIDLLEPIDGRGFNHSSWTEVRPIRAVVDDKCVNDVYMGWKLAGKVFEINSAYVRYGQLLDTRVLANMGINRKLGLHYTDVVCIYPTQARVVSRGSDCPMKGEET